MPEPPAPQHRRNPLVTTVSTHLPATRVQSATYATYAAFIGSGVALASWAARIPQVRDGLSLSPSALGLVLLSMAVGSIIALPLSGWVIAHFGARRAVQAMAVLLALG